MDKKFKQMKAKEAGRRYKIGKGSIGRIVFTKCLKIKKQAIRVKTYCFLLRIFKIIQ